MGFGGWRETRTSLEAKNPVIKAQVITEGDDKDLGSWRRSACAVKPSHAAAGCISPPPGSAQVCRTHPSFGWGWYTLLHHSPHILHVQPHSEGCVRILLWAQPCWLDVQIEAFYLLQPHLVQHSPWEFQFIPLVKQTDTQNRLKN